MKVSPSTSPCMYTPFTLFLSACIHTSLPHRLHWPGLDAGRVYLGWAALMLRIDDTEARLRVCLNRPETPVTDRHGIMFAHPSTPGETVTGHFLLSRSIPPRSRSSWTSASMCYGELARATGACKDKCATVYEHPPAATPAGKHNITGQRE